LWINPLNAKLYPIYHLLALLRAHPILHVSRIRVKEQESCLILNEHVDDEVQKNKIILVNFGHTVFSYLYINDNLAMQNLVGLHMVQFSVFLFGASYAKLGITFLI